MSDIRGYSTISRAHRPGRAGCPAQRHRGEMNRAILSAGGTVMQYVGDAVMAVFGAPEPCADHADRALLAAHAMHAAQAALNDQWRADGLAAFPIGIGLSTGSVAAALLGSEERLEYTVVGDAVNLCQRLQQFASRRQIVDERGDTGAAQRAAQRRRGPRGAARQGTDDGGIDHGGSHRSARRRSHEQHSTSGRGSARPITASVAVVGPRHLPHVRAATPRPCAPCAAPTSSSPAASSSP